MKKCAFIACYLFSFFVSFKGFGQPDSLKQHNKFMIRHSVIFQLKYPINSPEEKTFFGAAKKLENIPGVQHFEILKQTSKKNNFDYGISMEFDDQKQYDNYSNHPEHLQFIEKYWIKNVETFMEIDYELMK